MELLYGAITGILFGICLQRSEVLRYDRQLGALLLQDMTILKFMLTSICVGMVGVYLLVALGEVKLAVKPLVLGGNILGGLLFGVGWGLFGYCPATSVGAVAEGRWDAVWGILGALVGAGLYAESFPWLKETVLTWGNYGPVTVPQLLNVSPWLIIPAFIAVSAGLFVVFEKKGL